MTPAINAPSSGDTPRRVVASAVTRQKAMAANWYVSALQHTHVAGGSDQKGSGTRRCSFDFPRVPMEEFGGARARNCDYRAAAANCC